MSVLRKASLIVGMMAGIGCWLGASLLGFNPQPSRTGVLSLAIVGFVIGTIFLGYGLSPLTWHQH